jgi:serine/threonine protein kinase/Flp pilus assembly protein TadD
MPADLQKARELFLHAVGKLPPEQWEDYVAQACAGDVELAQQVGRLLQVHREAGSFLDHPAAAVGVSCALTPEPGAPEAETQAPALLLQETAGSCIGPYKLLEQIGEGGFGIVFMAEQQEPIRRKVALKVLKPGMDTRQVVARFEAERQALALMDHPNIARVFDAGTVGHVSNVPCEDGHVENVPHGGRPYFVMELVKGTPITKYCDEHRLTPRERLELFVPVCQAIQHAHQKGIIHRDIKPSNVLVTLHDGRPVVKVIDFGVAKAIGQRLTDRTLFTGFGAVIGTLEYMSPEQAVLNNQDIDTRSDVYSLGVLLYELLTDTTPLERKRAQDAGLVEALRIIREEETPRPSARLSTLAELPRVAADRGLEPKKLSSLVRGELDWIVLKALEKERARRYETASAFARDIERYLADEPVQACPPSAWYRGRKFARRHRTALAVAGLTLLFIALVGGGVAWAVGDRAARQARAANELELALDRGELFLGQGKRPEALAAFERAEMLASQIAPDPARDARLAALKERLAAAARDQQFSDRFEEIRLRVQSRVDVEQNRFTEAAAYPEIRDALQDYGIAIGVMAPAEVADRIQGRPEPVRRKLVAALDECLRLAPKEDVQARQWLVAALAVADPDAWRGRAREAARRRDWKALEERAREADVKKQPPSFLTLMGRVFPTKMKATRLELLRRTQRAHPADLWANLWLAWELAENGQPAEAIRYYTAALALRPDSPGIYLNRGFALGRAGELEAAIADARQAVALAPEWAWAHFNLGTSLLRKGQLDEAIAALREAIRLNKDFFEAHHNLGNALKAKGLFDEAIAAYQEVIHIKKDERRAHYGLGDALRAKGLFDEAIAAYREVIRLKKDEPMAHYCVGLALEAKGRLDDAIEAYREAIHLKEDYAEAHTNLSNALYRKGRLDEAIAAYRQAIRVKKDDFGAHNNLGIALARKGRLDEAIDAFRGALRIKQDFPEAHVNLGNAQATKGQLDDAIAAYREAIRFKKGYADAHCCLGYTLMQRGELREALAELRLGHQLGSKDPRLRYPSAQWVRQCERLVELDEQLPGLLEGKTQPASPAERIELARLCSLKRLHRGAARFYEEAFAAQPGLAANPGTGHRYNAACAAALAGCGQGQDALPLDEGQRARLRRQALDWLRADLTTRKQLLEKWPEQARAAVQRTLQHWQQDADLAGVRGAAVAKLPEAERQPWQQLWAEVEPTLRKLSPKGTKDAKEKRAN